MYDQTTQPVANRESLHGVPVKAVKPFACPKCGHVKNSVYDVVLKTFQRKRVRECAKCNHRFKTSEVLVD